MALPEPSADTLSGPAPTGDVLPANAVTEYAAKDTIDKRVDQEIMGQYRYPPAIPNLTSVTSTAQGVTDGATVCTVTVAWDLDRELLYDIQIQQTGQNPLLFSDLKSTPLQVYAQPTATELNVSIRARHPVSGFAGDFSPATVHTTAKDTVAPAAPATPSVDVSDVAGIINLIWAANIEPDFLEYIVHRSEGGGAFSAYADVRINHFEDSRIQPGITYCYKLTAVDRTKNVSGFSGQSCGSAKFVGTIPVTPQKTALLSPPAAFGDVYAQAATIPAGTEALVAPVTVRLGTPVGVTDTVRVRVIVTGPGGPFTSNEVALTFDQLIGPGQELTGDLTVVIGATTIGAVTITYQWYNDNTAAYQLTAPAAWRAF